MNDGLHGKPREEVVLLAELALSIRHENIEAALLLAKSSISLALKDRIQHKGARELL